MYRFDGAALTDAGLLATTAAVLFRQSDSHPKRIAEQMQRFAPALLSHGCLVFIQPLPAEEGSGNQHLRRFFVEAIDSLQLPISGLTDDEFRSLGSWFKATNRPMTPLVHVLGRPNDWQGLLMHLQLHLPGPGATPGPSIRHKDINGIERPLEAERLLLVQRAFWDSAEVRLEQLRNGLSGVDAYRAYVQQSNSVAGRYPLRYFAKVGPRDKVAAEYLAYRDIALEHLPYHLGPRLRLDRCELGHRDGILVSDYVNGAEPLRDCARDGRAAGVIANLFNVTFRGWHNGAQPDAVPLQIHLQARMPTAIPAFRKPLIDAAGATRTLDELGKWLVDGDSTPVSVGVIHGDLHATNVLVRGGDAILIDFEKVQSQGPVLRDLACLEGGLFVDGFVGERRDTASILASVKCLYTTDLLRADGRVTHCQPDDGSAWFFDCVMQIRMQARPFELAANQYALLLASELIRKSCNSTNFDEDTNVGSKPDLGRIRMEQTRAMAYVLAEWVLTGLAAVGRCSDG
ncbi:MAG: phosphotransferase [Betaproteobacteria bacterium]|nr:phosphotransferase [Betaproteobacteria bacterium]